MPFTGAAVQENVSDRVVRITGLSLAAAAVGTIGLDGGAGEVSLPDNFNPQPYGNVDLAEAVEVSVTLAGVAAVAPAIQVVKTASPFLVTMTNGGAAVSGALEIYLRFH